MALFRRSTKSGEVHILRAQKKLQSDDTYGAISEFSAAINLATSSAETRARAHIGRAVLKQRKGDINDAISDYLAVLQSTDVSPESREFASYLVQKMEQVPKGVMQLAKSILPLPNLFDALRKCSRCGTSYLTVGGVADTLYETASLCLNNGRDCELRHSSVRATVKCFGSERALNDALLRNYGNNDKLYQSSALIRAIVTEAKRRLDLLSKPRSTTTSAPKKERLIEFRCACGKTLTVKPQLIGKRARCPGCGETHIVPRHG